MRVLVVGRGPVARLLVTSLTPGHSVGLAVREQTAESLLVETRRLRVTRAAQRVEQRRAELVPADSGTTNWDVVITTASPDSPGMARLLGSPSIVAAVTQVPSEVDAL